MGFIGHTIWTRARLFFLVTLSVIAKYTARFVVQNTQIFSGSNNRGFNATEGFNGSRVASLFIYLFIYSYFFPASLLATTRCVKSSVQLSALYERNYDTSKRTLLHKSVCVPLLSLLPGRSICALLLSEIVKMYRAVV